MHQAKLNFLDRTCKEGKYIGQKIGYGQSLLIAEKHWGYPHRSRRVPKTRESEMQVLVYTKRPVGQTSWGRGAYMLGVVGYTLHGR
jgi:hypothetical protein